MSLSSTPAVWAHTETCAGRSAWYLPCIPFATTAALAACCFFALARAFSKDLVGLWRRLIQRFNLFVTSFVPNLSYSVSLKLLPRLLAPCTPRHRVQTWRH